MAKILVVDDEASVAAFVKRALAHDGHQVTTTSNGHAAVAALAAQPFALMLSDIVMPGLDGIALAKQAKLLQPDIKILFMTGYYARAHDAAPLGRILFKPVRQWALVEALHSLNGTEA